MTDERPGGLRERKRAAAMYRIQSVALDLFEQRGFDAVTVEEIAEASVVSPSSIYRYFGTKEQVILWDEFDPMLGDHIAAAMSDDVPLVGFRREIMATLDTFTPEDEQRTARRLRLIMSSQSLEAATVGQMYAASEVVGAALARRLGRSAVDLEVQVFSHAFIGGLLGALHHWHGTGFADPLREVLERCFVVFEEGLDVVVATQA